MLSVIIINCSSVGRRDVIYSLCVDNYLWIEESHFSLIKTPLGLAMIHLEILPYCLLFIFHILQHRAQHSTLRTWTWVTGHKNEDLKHCLVLQAAPIKIVILTMKKWRCAKWMESLVVSPKRIRAAVKQWVGQLIDTRKGIKTDEKYRGIHQQNCLDQNYQ